MARETCVDANFQMAERVSVALAVWESPSGILGLASRKYSIITIRTRFSPGLTTVIKIFKEEAVILSLLWEGVAFSISMINTSQGKDKVDRTIYN